MKFLMPVLMAVIPAVSVAQSPLRLGTGARGVPVPKTTAVIVMESPKPGVPLQQILAIMPAEARATLQLYLDGKIRQWYSRGDGKGVIFVVDATTEREARAVMDTLPLAKERLIDHVYIPVGPLMPLRALMVPTVQQGPAQR